MVECGSTVKGVMVVKRVKWPYLTRAREGEGEGEAERGSVAVCRNERLGRTEVLV